MQLDDPAWDENGYAGKSTDDSRRLSQQMEIYEAYPTHMQTTLLLPLVDWEQAVERQELPVSVAGRSLNPQTD